MQVCRCAGGRFDQDLLSDKQIQGQARCPGPGERPALHYIRSLWPDVPRHARQSAGHPTCSRRTSECLGRLFRLSRNDRTFYGSDFREFVAGMSKGFNRAIFDEFMVKGGTELAPITANEVCVRACACVQISDQRLGSKNLWRTLTPINFQL